MGICPSVLNLRERILPQNETKESAGMDRGYTFSAELLQMMLREERQKFLSALGKGASWKQLKTIRKNIIQISTLLDSTQNRGDSSARSNHSNPRD